MLVGMGRLFTLNRRINFLVIFIIILGMGCTRLPENRKWYSSEHLIQNLDKLKVGDIVVKDKRLKDARAWFGHAALMVNKKLIGDYPKIGVGYYEIGAKYWLAEERNVMVLRYKGFDEKFREAFLRNLEDLKWKKYLVSLDKKNEEHLYCSQFVWYTFYRTAKELGKNLDIDSDGGILVLPYDFIYSDELVQVDLD